jgi:predicted ATP-dependent endonuclease of OLD family
MLAFQILDFRSIKDTGFCTVTGDNITVLAGQNEAGKSAILMALRDFDLAEGVAPETPDYLPEGNHEAQPKVSVLFEVDADEFNAGLKASKFALPEAVYNLLKEKKQLWITRDLLTGKFSPSQEIIEVWPKDENLVQAAPPKESSPPATLELPKLPLKEFGSKCWHLWPLFVFFDSFQDQLPKKIAVEPLHQYFLAKAAEQTLPQQQAGQSSVEDFLVLAGIDLNIVVKQKDQDKSLGNYLNGRTAAITGDFLTYWKQAVDGKQTVRLQVRHTRNAQGVLQFSFYVHDEVDQYPEQRSKGFLWFLSFYLRLAAEEKRNPNRSRVLLIDEPGTYLHAKAQKDVLHLIEDKLAAKQQVIYSTHSPYLLPIDKLHRLRIVLRHGINGTITVDRLTHPTLRGSEFADTLSPIITAIGLDIRERISVIGNKNLLVEGLSDHTYLTAWAALVKHPINGEICIFPGTGAGTLTTLASLCIGWGLEFSVLLDRDKEGEITAKKFERELGLNPKRIIRPQSAITIEDLFEVNDFQSLLNQLDRKLKMEPEETPSKAIERLGVDKILLSRKFAEKPTLYFKSQPAFSRLLSEVEKSFS